MPAKTEQKSQYLLFDNSMPGILPNSINKCDSAFLSPRMSIQPSLKTKKNPGRMDLGFRISAWQFPTFAWQHATLSSALSGFTSEFGMGSGGSRSLWSPSKLVWSMSSSTAVRGSRLAVEICNVRFSRSKRQLHCSFLLQPPKPIGCYMVKPHGQLVHVSCTHYCASTPCLSTW